MTNTAGWVRGVFLASVAILVGGTGTLAWAKPPLDLAILRQQERNGQIRFEFLVDALGITDGMTVLDIGSGPGYASFLLAGKLGGTGTVFATDIRADFIDHIAGEAKRRGLANLAPVLVKEKGLDEFYGTHRYDLVLLSNVYHCLEDRVAYFRGLREFLNPGARLVLVMYNQVPFFSADDIADLDGLVGDLSALPGDDPFAKGLSEGARRSPEGKAGREDLVRALVDDFNGMLSDPLFYKGFYDNSYFRKGLFAESERDFANWLLMTIEEEGIPGGPEERIGDRARRAAMKLNRMFFVKRFGRRLAAGGAGAYLPAGDANRHTSRYVALRELGAAGFRFVDEIRLSAYYDAIVMIPDVRQRGE